MGPAGGPLCGEALGPHGARVCSFAPVTVDGPLSGLFGSGLVAREMPDLGEAERGVTLVLKSVGGTDQVISLPGECDRCGDVTLAGEQLGSDAEAEDLRFEVITAAEFQAAKRP